MRDNDFRYRSLDQIADPDNNDRFVAELGDSVVGAGAREQARMKTIATAIH